MTFTPLTSPGCEHQPLISRHISSGQEHWSVTESNAQPAILC